ncbi:pyruvate oxidase [Jeotgalibaca dankookensis]|uniref:pyruvate oxidase n=1 Tax=Jeotgalibaca dankookensis TaxID=708126 RepID=UPI0007834EE6|nr:pyruvate oxidase [Jeotgalibaca dankookensis]
MSGKITVGRAVLKIIESWGVKQIYGIPAGSLNSLMDSMYDEQDEIKFIQVRHEEVGALAASMQYKFSGNIGVALGSGGPGGTHLMNGLYDAREDRVPLLAIIGTRPLEEINIDGFQELNQNPIYADVSVYNARVAYAEQLPKIIDRAIREALNKRGPAIVEVPVDFGWAEIEDDAWYSSASSYREFETPPINQGDIQKAVELLEEAERPVIYAGIGTRGQGESVQELSHKIKAPIVTTGKNYDSFDFASIDFMGSAGRVAWKPANEIIDEADTILFIGSDYPFVESSGIFDNKKFIQIDIDAGQLGKRRAVDVAILGDAGTAIREITKEIRAVSDSPWYRASIANNENWRDYMTRLETKEAGDLQAFQIFNAINKFAKEDAIYSVDVGNVTQHSVRHLHLTPKNLWRTSPKFATMGNGLPGALAAKLEFPNRQVWNLSGDGGFGMVMQDIVTLVQYQLPSIHIVFSNEMYGFIKREQEVTNKNPYFGVDFERAVDYAKIARAQGAEGYTITKIEEIDDVFKKALADEAAGKTVIIDAKITDEQPIPIQTQYLRLDSMKYSEGEIKEYKDRYEAWDLKPFRAFLEAEGLKSKTE